jgi:hypothetical protein
MKDILIFIGSEEAIKNYREQIEGLRRKNMMVLVMVNEEVADTEN